MAKSRAQRKAEKRAREAEERARTESGEGRAQHDTQVGKSGEVAEVEAVEAGIAAGAREQDLETPDAPRQGPESKASRREKRQEEKRKKSEQKRHEEQQLAKRQKQAQVDRPRSGVVAFLSSCAAELRRVQWPDRDTLIQASAVTLVFCFVFALYLGLLDLLFNWLVQRII
ncbi:MAG: preprotein translocase subunit SecE [Solirubrobacterales bacterium]|nr:preprotein translocase subunit SecE [Solirubrobacterales bacterium]